MFGMPPGSIAPPGTVVMGQSDLSNGSGAGGVGAASYPQHMGLYAVQQGIANFTIADPNYAWATTAPGAPGGGGASAADPYAAFASPAFAAAAANQAAMGMAAAGSGFLMSPQHGAAAAMAAAAAAAAAGSPTSSVGGLQVRDLVWTVAWLMEGPMWGNWGEDGI